MDLLSHLLGWSASRRRDVEPGEGRGRENGARDMSGVRMDGEKRV